jgi:dimethylhistidine N-methyltransferase
MRTPHFIQKYQSDSSIIRRELSAGLLRPHAAISPKYLYDALGSKLFEAITCLPEYYPTRTEAAIFKAHLGDIARHVPPGGTLIDLGAGNCEKASRLFNALQPAHYLAVDISVEFLRGSLECLQRQFPDLKMSGLGLDFSGQLQLPEELQLSNDAHRMLFYPGSSIGNFTPDLALRFLQDVRRVCGDHPHSSLLIGVDLVKDVATLEAAYDDALGVTAAFNRNMLIHLNAMLGSDFDISNWKHVAFYNTQADRIEMHLEALQTVTVSWPASDSQVTSAPETRNDHEAPRSGNRQTRRFAHGERIHTENSCKWTVQRFEQLLQAAGFAKSRCYTDEAAQFAVFLAHVRNPD